MGLAEILDAIRREGEAEATRVEHQAEADAEAIALRARDNALRIEDAAAHSRDDEATAAVKRLRSRAALDSERMLRAARHEVFATVVARVRSNLADLRSGDDYPRVMRDLFAEARLALPMATVIRVDPRDRDLAALMRTMRGEDTRRWRIEPVLTAWGGLELATDDGRLVRNTLESRLDRAGSHLRRLAAATIPPLAGGVA